MFGQQMHRRLKDVSIHIFKYMYVGLKHQCWEWLVTYRSWTGNDVISKSVACKRDSETCLKMEVNCILKCVPAMAIDVLTV